MSVDKTPNRKVSRPRKKSVSTPAAAIDRWKIEREAYLRAERRGFEPGHELEDWLAAEHLLGARADA